MCDSDENGGFPGDLTDLASVSGSEMAMAVEGEELVAVERVSVDPGDGDPLGGGGHQVHGLLQQPDGVVDLVVDDGLVEVVGVSSLEHLGFFLESLERIVLRGEEGRK